MGVRGTQYPSVSSGVREFGGTILILSGRDWDSVRAAFAAA